MKTALICWAWGFARSASNASEGSRSCRTQSTSQGRAQRFAAPIVLALLLACFSRDAFASNENQISVTTLVTYRDDSKHDETIETGVVTGDATGKLDGFPDGGEYHIECLAKGHQFDLSTMASTLVAQREAGANAAWIDDIIDVAARARFIDTIGIGTVTGGRISYHFEFDGSAEYYWRRDGGDVNRREMLVSAQLLASHNGSTHDFPIVELEPNQIFGSIGEVFSEKQTIHRTGSYTVPFNKDEPIDFSFLLSAENHSDIRNIDGGAISGNMNANFSSTARLLGVTIYDDQGQIVLNPPITSAAGLVYNVIVPEPASCGQLATAIVALILGASRIDGARRRLRLA